MEFLLIPLLITIALFLVFCWILRWMLGTDKLIEHAKRQTELLEKLVARSDGGKPRKSSPSERTVFDIKP